MAKEANKGHHGNYISFKEVIEHFSQADSDVNQGVFSFQPLIDKTSSSIISLSSETKTLLEDFKEKVESNKLDYNKLKTLPELKTITNVFFEPLFLGFTGVAFLSPPFSSKIIFANKVFDEMVYNDQWEINFNLSHDQSENQSHFNFDQLLYILNKFYHQNISGYFTRKLSFRHKKTGVIRYFKMESNYNFFEAKINHKLPELSKEDIDQLLNNFSDELFRNKIDPTCLTFYGFEITNFIDITEIEAVNQLRYRLIEKHKIRNTSFFLDQIKSAFQSILNQATFNVGLNFIGTLYGFQSKEFGLTGLSGKELIEKYVSLNHLSEEAKLFFGEKKAIAIKNLSIYAKKKSIAQLLHKKGYKSAILIPIKFSNGALAVAIEIATKNNTHEFSQYTLKQLRETINVIDESFYQDEIRFGQMLVEVIQNKFTNIHPTVKWRFEKAAATYLSNMAEQENVVIQPIKFNQLHTIYGQADIVNSSVLRNRSIKLDLIKNLELLEYLLDHTLSQKKHHFLSYYQNRIKIYLQEIHSSFNSNHEIEIVNFITKNVNPYLEELSLLKENQIIPSNLYENYLQALDKEFNIVYWERKKFEESVNQLNSLMSAFIDKQDEEMQAILPHYYEKYKTDGIEYNIYLGQSLLQTNQKYTVNDLRNFQIWQLVMMCQLVQLVEKNKITSPIPLSTAQLIFVYNQSISILFRMDEKRFDVDGAYNIRYEILKKRIDKATIKGTTERLTVEGKIAIVYLSDEDKRTYLAYFQYLKEHNFIEEAIEDLELNKLKGTDGLKALRITVRHHQNENNK